MIEIVSERDLLPELHEFVRRWSKEYFGGIDASEELEETPVHCRIFLRSGNSLVSHVAVTEFPIDVDGKRQTMGAIGGLFTVHGQMGQGYGNRLMTAAEAHVFETLNLPIAILFCLPHMRGFYERRQWQDVLIPVSMAQSSGIDAVWPESVMVLPRCGTEWNAATIRVPPGQNSDTS